MEKLIILALLVPMAEQANKVLPQRLFVEWKTFKCAVNPDIISQHKCFIIEPAKALITAELSYKQDVAQYNSSFVLMMPRPPKQEWNKVFSLNIDLCRFKRDALKNKFISIAYKSITRDSNLAGSCPRPKGFYFYRDINIADHLPPFLPRTDFKLYLNLFTPQKWMVNISLSGRLFDSNRLIR